MSNDLDELFRPAWLDAISKCPFCQREAHVSFQPDNPLAAAWRCEFCGASGVVSPPRGTVPIERAIVI